MSIVLRTAECKMSLLTPLAWFSFPIKRHFRSINELSVARIYTPKIREYRSYASTCDELLWPRNFRHQIRNVGGDKFGMHGTQHSCPWVGSNRGLGWVDILQFSMGWFGLSRIWHKCYIFDDYTTYNCKGPCKLNTRGMKNWYFSTNISLYFENGTRYGHSYNGRPCNNCRQFCC